MEDIIGGCCFGYRNTNSPHSIQARALVCWVSRLFLPGLPLTSADASLHLPQSADYIFHCRYPGAACALLFHCFLSFGSLICLPSFFFVP